MTFSRSQVTSRKLFAFLLVSSLILPAGARAAQLKPGDIVVTGRIGPASNSNHNWAVFVIDPLTGNRTILSDASNGNVALQYPAGMAYTPDGNLLVGDGSWGLERIDPATGDRTRIATDFFYAVQQVGSQIYGMSEFAGYLETLVPRPPPQTTYFSIVISGASHGTGPEVLNPFGLVVTGDVAYVTSTFINSTPGADGIVKIDLTTGNRTLISGAMKPSGVTVGSGPASPQPINMTIEANGNLLVTNYHTQGIMRIEPVTGARTVVSSSTVGTGPLPALVTFAGVPASPIAVEANGTILLGAGDLGALLRVDPLTGDRTIFSDATHGSGPTFTSISAIVVVPNVPKPSTFVLATIGVVALFLVQQRRRATR